MGAIKSSSKQAQVASHVPGRLRLKLHPQHRDAKILEGIKRQLGDRPGIEEIRLNPACGSLTVHYDNTQHSMSGILGFLEDIDVIVDSIGHLPSVDDGVEAESGNGTPEFVTAVNDLNQRLRGATGLPLDLKKVLPLAFVGAGAWSIARRGLMIETVPGWLFLWFAFDIFVKLHSGRSKPRPESAE